MPNPSSSAARPDEGRPGPRPVSSEEGGAAIERREPITSRFLQHFLFVEDPFSLSPDPRYLYLSESHGEALAALDLGITERRGLIVLIGEVGTGKTTLAHHIASTLGSEVRVALVSNTTLSFGEMLDVILRELRRPQPHGTGKGEMIEALHQLAVEAHQQGGTVALLVDEAQNLELDVLEEFRQLLNIETDTDKLIQIVLIGQPELHEKLSERRVRHVSDRIAVRCVLDPLSQPETREYIAHRLDRAGGTLAVFSKAALKAIVRESRGLPRSVNVLCHNSLLFAFGKGDEVVRKEEALQAIRERRGTKPRRARSAHSRLGILAAAVALVLLGAVVTWLLLRGVGTDSTGSRETAPIESGQEVQPAPVEAVGAPSSGSQESETEPSVPEAGGEAVAPPSQAAGASGPSDDVALDDTDAGPQAGVEPAEDTTIVEASGEGLVVRVERGMNLHDLMLSVYGTYRPDLIAQILDDNPEIEDPNLLFPGQVIRLPSVAGRAPDR